MKPIILFPALFFLIIIQITQAQITGPTPPESFNSISQNSISNMGALGDTLWVGPQMMRNIRNDIDFVFPEGADSIASGKGRMFSIALAADTIFAGLGFNDFLGDGTVQTGFGFHTSTDGGETWSYIPQPLDNQDETTFTYGGQQIESIPIIVPQQSPPFNVVFRGATVLYAGWASGIRRSKDFGETWERVLLPPTGIPVLRPEDTYDFIFDPRLDNNFLGFSVMIDNQNRVWAGTAGGINVSDNALTAPTDSIRWRNSNRTGSSNSLLGNWIIQINQNTHDDKVWMTNWIAEQGDQQGLVSTTDGGETFTRHLIGERLYDIAFDGETIYASGDNGLFISPDNGITWNQIRQITNPNTFIKASANYLSMAKTTDRLWVGTTDGLASTDDGGETWQITRVNFPLRGGNQFNPNARSVDAFAYPNPFSPRVHEVVRIKFEAPASGNAQISMYDFGMNLIRTLDNGFSVNEGQTYEAVWDGTDGQGRFVANGAVFYVIQVGNADVRGKILILE